MKTDNGGMQSKVPQSELLTLPPQWFTDALSQVGESHFVPYQDTELHFLFWPSTANGDPKNNCPSIVLLHGDGAHARWYDFIAPMLTPHYNVISLDLPGMGDSGWLRAYSREIMAEAVITIIRAAGLRTKPALIAHSFGGLTGLLAAHHYADELVALMICDFHVRPLEIHNEWFADTTEPRPVRFTDTRDTLEKRFRLLPEQTCPNQFILDHIASHSIRHVTKGANPRRHDALQTGWTWKFDPNIYPGFVIGTDLIEIYKNLPMQVAAMFGALAHDFDTMTRLQVVDFMRGLRPDGAHYDIAGARHHIMLDQPHAFACAILAQMENWRAGGAFS